MIRAEKDEEPRWWLAAGAIGGIAFLAKYTVALYLVSIALGLLATSQRRLLARRQPWAGVVIAIVIAAPNLLWQAANGWPFVAHIAALAAEKNIPVSPFSNAPCSSAATTARPPRLTFSARPGACRRRSAATRTISSGARAATTAA